MELILSICLLAIGFSCSVNSLFISYVNLAIVLSSLNDLQNLVNKHDKIFIPIHLIFFPLTLLMVFVNYYLAKYINIFPINIVMFYILHNMIFKIMKKYYPAFVSIGFEVLKLISSRIYFGF